MQTMSVLVVAAPLAFVIGISLGIAAWQYRWLDTAINPVLSALQTLPFFTCLPPAVIFFKVGPTAGAIAATIYAIPPMILMTTLELKKVSPEVVEAGKMSGCSRFQMLRHVYVPSARTDILVGLNQAIMFAFFMVIIAAFIGTQDLGQELQRTLAGTDLGKNFVLGLCVSLMALTFDLTPQKRAADKKKALGLDSKNQVG